MGVVKNLLVRIGADVRGVVTGMDKAKSATSSTDRSIQQDTASVRKSVKECYEDSRKSVREYAEEVTAIKTKHQTAAADVERMTDKVHQLEETYGTIVNATDGLDLTKSLSDQIASAEKDLDGINARIHKTRTALSALGTPNSGKKVERVASLQEELRDLMSQSDAAAEHLRALDAAAARVGEANMGIASTAGLKQMQTEIEAAKSRLNTAKILVEETDRKMRSMGIGMTWGQMVKAEWEKVKAAAGQLKPAWAAAWSDMKAGAERVCISIRSIPARALSFVTAGFAKLSNAIRNIPNVPGNVARGIRNIGNIALAAAGSGLKQLAREMARLTGSAVRGIAGIPGRLLNIGKGASSGCGGLNRMVRSIRNIGVVSLGLRVAGGLFGRLRSIISSYVYTNEGLNASVTSLRNQMGEALMPAINLVIGAMERLMPIVTKISGAISSVFVALFGNVRSTTGAIKSAASDAGKAADSLDTYGFDQITKVSDNSSGGGSSSSASASAQELQNHSALAQKLTAWLSRLKAAFAAGDWRAFGTILGDGINAAVSAIDKSNIGAKLGTFLQNANTALHGLAKTLDFGAIGGMVGRQLTAAFEQIDWNMLGEVLGAAMTALPAMLVGFILTTDWGVVAQDLSSCLKSLMDSVSAWFQSVDWLQVGQCIADFIANVDWAGLATSLFSLLGAALGATVATLWGCIDDAVQSIKDYFAEKIDAAGGDVAKGLLDGIIDGLGNIATWIYDNIISPFMDGFSSVFPDFSQWCEENLVEPIASFFTDISEGAVKAFEDLWGGIKGWINSIIGGVESMVNLIVRGVNKLISGFNKIASVGEYIGLDLTISEISTVSLPKLAKGAIVNRPTPAIIGEAGREAVIPLENNTGWMDTVAEKISSKGSGGKLGPFVFQIIMGGRKVTERVIDDINQITQENGVCPIRV